MEFVLKNVDDVITIIFQVCTYIVILILSYFNINVLLTKFGQNVIILTIRIPTIMVNCGHFYILMGRRLML